MRQFLCAALCLTILTAASLPVAGPVPEAKPADDKVTSEQKDAVPEVKPAEEAVQPKTDTDAAVPEKKPTAEAVQPKTSSDAAVPEKKPPVPDADKDKPVTDKPREKAEPGKAADTPATEKPATDQTETPAVAPPPEEVLTIEPEDGKAYDICVAALQAIGAEFKPATRIDDAHGCGIDRPITVSKILPDVALTPGGMMRCETALALARWTKESVIPAASVAVPDGGKLTALNQASTYICRLRNNAETGKISEHARGNATDVASFSFEKAEPIEIKPRKEDTTLSGAFQRTVSASACLYFSTVLDPESDAAHENHLHLDVLKRKGGYRYCR